MSLAERQAKSQSTRVGRFVAALAIACASVVALPAAALANGTVDVTIDGVGSGTVTSTTNGTGGPIECHYDGSSQSGACSAAFSGGEFGVITKVTLTATGDPGAGYLTGWSQSGASSSTGCTTPPEASRPTCEVTLLAGTSTVTATFGVPPDPPVAVTGVASDITGTEATMHGTVDPEGAAVGDCHFEYGTTSSYGASVPCEPAAGTLTGDAPVSVSARTEPVEGGATYHYRLVASNVGGSSEGADRTFSTVGAPACPNAARRLEQGIVTVLLPDCMALEQVSPPEKNNAPTREPVVSADGSRVSFFSTAVLGGSPGLAAILGDTYVAGRTATGWQTETTRPPARQSQQWNAGPASFSSDLSSWVDLAATPAGAERGRGQVLAMSRGGSPVALSPQIAPLVGGQPVTLVETVLQGASADHSHVSFSSNNNAAAGVQPSRAYLPGDPTPLGPGSQPNGYVAHRSAAGEPTIELLARDAAGRVWGDACGAGLAAGHGAVSASGTTAYLQTRPGQPSAAAECGTANGLRILKRVETADGPWIRELFSPECERTAPPCSAAEGDDTFVDASLDQSRVYFTSTRQLASSDRDSTSDLYLYDATRPAGERLVQISAGGTGDPTPGEGANVGSANVVAVSGDGSRAYFISTVVLTTAPDPALPAGNQTAAAGQRNLYLYKYPAGELSFVATLASGDLDTAEGRQDGAYAVPLLGADPDVGGDGHVLVFASRASFTSDDGDGGRRDIYRFDSAGSSPTLECVSCAPGVDSAQFDSGTITPPGTVGTDFAERSASTNSQYGRQVSEGGEAITFTSGEKLTGAETDGAPHTWLWWGGRLAMLPGEVTEDRGRVSPLAATISGNGATVAFGTATALLPTDKDLAPDVYVARADGGFAPPPQEGSDCEREACQGPAVRPSSGSGAATAAPAATAGNVKPPASRRCPRGKHRVTRHGKQRCLARHKRHRHHKRHRKHTKHRNAKTDRRGAK